MPDRSKLDGATDDHAGSAMTRHYLRRNMALVMQHDDKGIRVFSVLRGMPKDWMMVM